MPPETALDAQPSSLQEKCPMTTNDSEVPRLVIIGPAELASQALLLASPQLVIGHSDTADLVLDDRFVSRRHALVTVEPSGQVTIRDLNSTGGTFVNDERLDGPRVLQPGDTVRFADLVARFEPGGGPGPAVGVATVSATQPMPVLASAGPAAGVPSAGAESAAGDGPPADTGPASPGGPAAAGPEAVGSGPTYTVTGTALSPALPGIGGLTVQLVDKNVGGDQILASTQTASDGSYIFEQGISAQYLARYHKASPDLQVQVLVGGSVLASSEVSYSASATAQLDVVLPASADGLPSEHETLTANLSAAYPGRLGDLQENASQQDITYLANKTGWDARAVALAALADQFSQLTAPAPQVNADPAKTAAFPVPTVSIPAQFYYALFRAGLPADADSLFQVSPATVTSIWEQAVTVGVIPQALAKEVPVAAARFQAIAAARLPDAAPPAGLSPLREMLAANNILPESAQQDRFAQLYTQHQGDWAGFWTAVDQAFGTPTTTKLQLAGKLFYLTINNAPLVTALTNAEAKPPLTSTADLASRGYYDAAKWVPLIGASIPPGIPGDDADVQASNYARLLAAQVRVAHPTAVMADQVRRSILPVGGTADETASVAGFLATHQDDFVIGAEPIDAYTTRKGLAGTAPEVVSAIKRLQRVYQLTPDDASMSVLLAHNLHSAFAVTRYDSAGFVRAFADELGGADPATMIHTRARQIFATTLGVTIGYLSGRRAPVLGGSVPVQFGFPPQQATPSFPVTAYPTLEGLFGSLDYCNCSDCGSILSPAAYLVDLLNYIDQPAPTGGLANPLDVLLSRRPDLQELPLTCANTNTALPYIDVVNELLEYFVANRLNIAGYQGHDTGDTITAAELAASPQYVNDAAYATLRQAYFPPPLPFNRPLELLRLLLDSLGISLPAAMATLRGSDKLTDDSTPTSYGWTDILLEQLAISRDERKLFTDNALQLSDLYGLAPSPPGPQTPLQVLQTTSMQTFSRRLGVSYKDLIAIVQTQFINPNAALIPRLERLSTSFETLAKLKATVNTPGSIAAEFIATLPAGLDATQYGGASPTDYQAVVNWITDPANYQRIMSIIVITDPSGSGNDCSGASLQLRYSNPDSNPDSNPGSDPGSVANQLSGTDFIKLIRFIRLWKKLAPLLGDPSDQVTIAQTDNIITALYPAAELPVDSGETANDPANRTRLDAGFATLLPRVGFLFQVLNSLKLTADAGLAQLLACWAPIGTVDANSAYSTMFLSPALLAQDQGAQTATVASTINTGDKLHTTIDGADLPPYQVPAGQNAAAAALAIAQSINTSTAADPATTSLPGLPSMTIGNRFYAAATGSSGVITIKAGFSLQCSVAPAGAATETYTATTGTPVSASATVAGTGVTAGDTLTTTINAVPVGYQVTATDTFQTIAAGIAAAVNATTTPDPYSGLPLNGLVVAEAAAGSSVVSFTIAGAGAPFTLACSLEPANAGTYTAGAPTPAQCTASITGNIAAGDTFVTTVNGVPVSYAAGPGDTGPDQLATSIAAAVNAAVGMDQATGLPLSSEVRATSSGDVVTITPVDPSTPVTLACATTAAAATYTAAGPFPETGTAVVSGTIPAGTTLTTTIDTLPVVYKTAAGDTPLTIATAIANLINSSAAVDPTNGLPLSSVVTATGTSGAGVSEGIVTVTAQSLTTPFTLAAAMSAAGYTAGQATPPFADDGYGDFLADPAQTVFGHEPTLCAACNLTSAEFMLICEALGYNASTLLTLGNVSALFRNGWLAQALGLPVQEFLLLCQWTGLNPFDPLDPGTSAPAEPAVIRFIRLLNVLQAAGLTINQALYLMWNQDLSGTSAPPLTTVTGLARALAADFAAADAQFTLPPGGDPDGSIAQGLMTLVYGTDATTFFFGLLNGTFTTSVEYSTPPGDETLQPQVIAASSGRLSYDNLAKQLTFGGLLDQTTQTAIDTQVTAFAPDVAVLTAAIAGLAAATGQATAPFFDGYPELRQLYLNYAASSDPVQDRRTALLAAVLPTLRSKRKQEQALAEITSAAGTDPSFATALLQDPAILHADADPSQAAIADLTAIESQGLSAQFFLGNNLAGTPDPVPDPVPELSYAPTATISGPITNGDVLTTTVNGIPIPYQVGSAATATPPLGPPDTSHAALAGNVAAAINRATTADGATGLPISKVVTASVLPASQGATASVIVITGLDPSGKSGYLTLATSVSAAATVQYTAGSQLPAGTGGGDIAAVWSGYLTVPQDGLYDINVAADPGSTISLQIGGVLIPPSGPQPGGLWSNAAPISLTAGALAPITLTATSIKTTLTVRWQSQGMSWQLIPAQYLYPATLVTRLGDTYVRFLKASSLATDLSLTAKEIAFLGTGWLNSLIGAGWQTALPQQPGPDPATAAKLAEALQSIADFAVMKAALSPSDGRLLAVLKNPSAQLPVSPAAVQPPATALPVTNSALLSLTGWTLASVNALLSRFFGSTNPVSLTSVANLRRVYDAYALITSSGLSAATLIAAITNSPLPTTVGALESALRAQYAAADWLTVIKPVNDQARTDQRDALVAYIVQQLGDAYVLALVSGPTTANASTGASQLSFAATNRITDGMTAQGAGIPPGTTVTNATTTAGTTTVTLSMPILTALPSGSAVTFVPQDAVAVVTADDLYQNFLVDTQNQPPVLTSRILLAISTVQLFIERVVRNLESQVSAADIDRSRWTWMKRYRVWQANREVFLWPENWAYPDLRDDQSPFFQQMMSSLLQGDITDDAAASAYLDYLTSLEQVAKLEPCGLYYKPGDADTDETSYVVARTAGAHRKYYFRELTGGSWTPWTEVKIDCEDMPITPIVWNNRLFIFWLKIIKQTQPPQSQLTSKGDPSLADLKVSALNTSLGNAAKVSNVVTVGAVLCWSEYYNGKWQPTKTSDVNAPTSLGPFPASGPGSFEANRTLVRIVPAQFTGTSRLAWLYGISFRPPSDALLLAITSADSVQPAGGFLLHNTHSLPVRFDDIAFAGRDLVSFHGKTATSVTLLSLLDDPSPFRSFSPAQSVTGGYGSGTFTISYAQTPDDPPTVKNDILKYDWAPRWVDVQPGLPDAWDAPFIYEDRRFLFYVTTTISYLPIDRYRGYGLLSATASMPKLAHAISPIVLRKQLTTPTPEQILAVNSSVGDTAVSSQRFLSQQSTIQAGLAMPVAVSYQGQLISPAGSLPAVKPTADGNGQGA
jgi:hypothetical protein